MTTPPLSHCGIDFLFLFDVESLAAALGFVPFYPLAYSSSIRRVARVNRTNSARYNASPLRHNRFWNVVPPVTKDDFFSIA